MSSTASDIHVVFGTGPLGLAAAGELSRRGLRTRLVNRSGKRPSDCPTGAEVVSGNASDPAFCASVCQGAGVVYMCAQPPYHRWPEEFPQMLAAVMSGAESAGAKFVMGDNLYPYGKVEGPIHEGLPFSAGTRKGRTRAEMDRAILEAHLSGRLRAVIARGSDFFGPGVLESSLGERAILPAIQGKTASMVGNLDMPHTFTYIEDFGKALVILGENDSALGQSWHVPNAPALTQRQILTLFFDELGLPPRMSGMGRLMMSLGGLFVPGARETVEMMYEFEKPFVVDSSKFEKAFGVQATPLREAVKATLSWYKKHIGQTA